LAVTVGATSSISELHKVWAKLENEHHHLANLTQQAAIDGADVTLLRDRQARLLLDIHAVVAEIREAPASSLEDYLALLDVAIEHEIDLAIEIGLYGPTDFPMISRLLAALAKVAPQFEFNSLRRWVSSPGQLKQLVGDAARFESAVTSGA
jgi:hypothetical protein